ncbi:MAG: hypothetical protein ACK4RK_06595 [Gemmataceae bacterium]
MRHCYSVVLWLIGIPAVATAESLPVVREGEFAELATNCRRLLEMKPCPVPADCRCEVNRLLDEGATQPAEINIALQKLLDEYCLIGVHINPESRVKAARGPAVARLRRGQPSFALIKVHNEAGITHALAVRGPGIRQGEKATADAWLSAQIVADAPLSKTLTGAPVEYVVLRLEPHETGRREATLQFDAGQGTQDLGFRAEVPVLFHVTSEE